MHGATLECKNNAFYLLFFDLVFTTELESGWKAQIRKENTSYLHTMCHKKIKRKMHKSTFCSRITKKVKIPLQPTTALSRLQPSSEIFI